MLRVVLLQKHLPVACVKRGPCAHTKARPAAGMVISDNEKNHLRATAGAGQTCQASGPFTGIPTYMQKAGVTHSSYRRHAP